MTQHEPMANCPKCTAELGVGAKFCTGCGMPVLLGASEAEYAPPVSKVNPFATTASPNQPIAPPSDAELAKALSEAAAKAAVDPAAVSPLAVSGAVSERGSFHQVAASVKELRSPSAPPPAVDAQKKPGTQMMPGAPNKVVQRTVAMNASALAPSSNPTPSSASPSGQYNAANVAQPASRGPYGPNPGPVAGGRPNAPYPGAHVLVTWSNGQRYPATVNHVNGSQCLVVFPDGQQHWVDQMYLSPA